jgi:hypothetical protein
MHPFNIGRVVADLVLCEQALKVHSHRARRVAFTRVNASEMKQLLSFRTRTSASEVINHDRQPPPANRVRYAYVTSLVCEIKTYLQFVNMEKEKLNKSVKKFPVFMM